MRCSCCRAFDQAVAEQQRHTVGGAGSGVRGLRGVEQDPWLTEGRLVEQQTSLQVSKTVGAGEQQQQQQLGHFMSSHGLLFLLGTLETR